MNDARIAEFRAFIAMLNDEGTSGPACARALLDLPTDDWEGAIVAHPEWLRVGTMRSLLRHADDLASCDLAPALAIAAFVITHVHDVPVPPDGHVLVDPLEGEAHTARANALLASGDPAAALDEISLAEGLLALVPIAAIERADATLVRARICGFLRRDDEALDLFDDCLRVYADHWSCCKYARALSARAILLSDMRQWGEAWHTLHHAEETVASLHYDELTVELREVVEHCYHMGLPNDGSDISTVAG
jgi:hypothetical protein